MAQGGTRQNVRHAEDNRVRGGKRDYQPGRPKKSHSVPSAWKADMWSKYGRAYWEKQLAGDDPKAQLELLKRVLPEIAKLNIGGDDGAEPIRIMVMKPKDE